MPTRVYDFAAFRDHGAIVAVDIGADAPPDLAPRPYQRAIGIAGSVWRVEKRLAEAETATLISAMIEADYLRFDHAEPGYLYYAVIGTAAAEARGWACFAGCGAQRG